MTDKKQPLPRPTLDEIRARLDEADQSERIETAAENQGEALKASWAQAQQSRGWK